MATTYIDSGQVGVGGTAFPDDGGNYNLLSDYFNAKRWQTKPFLAAQTVVVASANVVAITSAMIPGTIALGTTTAAVNGGVAASKSAGFTAGSPVGSATDFFYINGVNGIIGNLINIRDSANDTPIYTSGGLTVYGLVQSATDATGNDNVAIGTTNLQLSFVFFNSSDVLTLTAINNTIDFDVNVVYSIRNFPANWFTSTPIDVNVIGSNTGKKRTLAVTTQIPAATTIDLTLANGSHAVGSGVATFGGDNTMTLPTSSALMEAAANFTVLLNGVTQSINNGDINWLSTTTFNFALIVKKGSYIEIREL